MRRFLNWWFILGLSVFYCCMYYGLYPKADSIDQNVVVIAVDNLDTYNRYTVLSIQGKYHLNHQVTYHVGDIINIQGELEVYRQQTIPGGFNSFRYWLGKDIKGIVRLQSIRIIQPSILRKVAIKGHVFFELFKDQVLIESTWMSHLFRLSSIHLTFIIMILMKLLYYLDIENQKKYMLVSIFMFIVYFVGFSVIVLRMCIKYFIQYLNLKLNIELDNFNIESLTFISIICIQPYVVYNQSFLVIYTLIFFMQLKTNVSNLQHLVSVPMIIAPFLLHWYKDISILSLMVIPVFAYVLKYVFVPTLILASMLPILNIMAGFNDIMISIESFLSIYDLRINVIHIEGILWVIYFVIVIFVLAAVNKRALYRRLIVYSLLCIVSFIYTFKPLEDAVIFLDVGQGDSAVIFKDNKVIVVDAYQSVSTYLKYKHVKKIDYLILTHPDTDHIKEVDDILDNFEVGVVFLSVFNTYNIRHPNIHYIGPNNLYIDKTLGITFLGPLEDLNSLNENSIVFKIEVNQMVYLFTGDIGIPAEMLYVNQYGNTLKSDVLKSPHHGSSTSSSSIFLSLVRPSIIVVSVGHRNVYRLPSDEIIKRYENLGVYLHETRHFGSLIINKEGMKNFPP